mmetsp:Transcript_15944/g.43455  ORF Transcript_15944/g.43455 Transcript_15944/m.43455 type:complete len:125 (+) Transcript_15944:355-729(+)
MIASLFLRWSGEMARHCNSRPTSFVVMLRSSLWLPDKTDGHFSSHLLNCGRTSASSCGPSRLTVLQCCSSRRSTCAGITSLILEAVKHDRRALQYVGDLRSDYDLVLAAVTKNWRSLQYDAPSL